MAFKGATLEVLALGLPLRVGVEVYPYLLSMALKNFFQIKNVFATIESILNRPNANPLS
jgi:hypothetical protein